MEMYILVTDTGMYVNHRMESLEEHKDLLHVVKLDPKTDLNDEDIEYVDLSMPYNEMGTVGSGYDSWQYKCIDKHKNNIADMFVWRGPNGLKRYSDLIILGDVIVDALYVLNALQKTDFNGNIHLILPLPFEKTVKGSIQNELLSDLSRVRSLAIYDPYKLSLERYGNADVENVERVINKKTSYLLRRYYQLFSKMQYMSDSRKYFFDFDKDSFIDTDSLYVLDDYEITHTLGLMIDPYLLGGREENDYFIECLNTPIPRPDGKEICEKLRVIRQGFASINGIEYDFKSCSYNGPCAGTCAACDKEARDLGEIAKTMAHIVYPKVEWEER